MKQSVFGILRGRDDAERVVDRLKTTGFLPENISVLFPGYLTGTEEEKEFHGEHGTKAPEGAATGGTTGFVVGGVLGWLAGIGSLAIPGIGPFIAAGPILAALSGAAVGAAVGGITGTLIGLGIPEHEAHTYETRLKEGNILVSVHTDSEVETRKAGDILKEMDAEEIAYGGDTEAEAKTAAETGTGTAAHTSVESRTEAEKQATFREDPFGKDKRV